MESEEAKERRAQARRYRQLAREASRPDTPPGELRRLSEEAGAEYVDRDVLRPLVETLLSHPNCPPDVMRHWLYVAPEAFFRNPILPLLPLEYPDFFESESESLLLFLLSYASIPSPLVRLLAASSRDSVAETARCHIALTGEAGAEWKAEVQTIVESLPLVHGEEYQALAALGLLPTWLAERVRVMDEPPAIPVPEKSWVAPCLKHIVFPETPRMPPPGGWDTLLKKNIAARIVLARDVTQPPEALLALAGDREHAVRLHLVKNPMATPEVLMRLAGSDGKVKELAAIHPNATAPVLRRLIADSWSLELAYRILRRPHLTPGALSALAEHNSREILRIVYHHPLSWRNGSLRPPIARRLQAKTLAYLQEIATERWRDEGDRLMGYIVLDQSATPRQILTGAALSPYWLRRVVAARHPNTPPKVRKRLAEQDGNRFVRAAARDALANGVS